MQRIAHESAKDSTGAVSVLTALNSNHSAAKGEGQDSFAMLLQESSSVVKSDERREAGVLNEAGDARDVLAASRGEGTAEVLDGVGDVGSEIEDDGFEVGSEDGVVEAEVVEIEENAALLVEEMLAEFDEVGEVLDGATSDMPEGVEDIVAEEAEIISNEAAIANTDECEPDVAAEMASESKAALIDVDATVDSVDASLNGAPKVTVEKVVMDGMKNATQTQSGNEAGQETAGANLGVDGESGGSQTGTTNAANETDINKIAADLASVAEVTQENSSKISEGADPIVEAYVSSGQNMSAASEEAVSKDTGAKDSEGEAVSTADLRPSSVVGQPVADGVELHRQMNQVRMQDGTGEVERKVLKVGQETSVEAVAGSIKSEAGQSVTSRDGLGEVKSEPLNTTRFIQDIISQAKMLSKPDGSTEMRLRLDPPELGSVVMRLSLNNNKLDVQLEVDSPAVREMVGESLQRVKELLSDDGVDLEKFDIGLRRQPNQGSEQNGRQESSRREDADDWNSTADGRVVDPRADALQRATLSAAGMIDFTA